MKNIEMAGAEGFEPTNARIKTWCLNRLATPLQVSFFSPVPELRVQNRAIHAICDPGFELWRQTLLSGLGFCKGLKPHKTAAAGAGQACRTELGQDFEQSVDCLFPCPQNRLEGIAEHCS